MIRRASRCVRYEPEPEPQRQGSGIGQVTALLTVVFMIALGVVIATRLSSDAIAVLVGVIAGVAASLPCALLLMAITRRQENRIESEDRARRDMCDDRDPRAVYADPRRAIPPVIVVTPNQAASQQIAPWAGSQGMWPPAGAVPGWEQVVPSRPQRQFRVMGYQEDEEQDAPYAIEAHVPR
jgi:hypothetical protein